MNILTSAAACLTLLACFSSEQPELDLHDVAARLGVPFRDARRHADTLALTGYLRRYARGKYRLAGNPITASPI